MDQSWKFVTRPGLPVNVLLCKECGAWVSDDSVAREVHQCAAHKVSDGPPCPTCKRPT